MSQRQDLQRENHLFHKVGIGGDNSAISADTFCKNSIQRHPAEHNDGKSTSAAAKIPPARFENDAENKGIYAQHHKGLNKTPDQSQPGTAVTAGNIADTQLPQQGNIISDDARQQCYIKYEQKFFQFIPSCLLSTVHYIINNISCRSPFFKF